MAVTSTVTSSADEVIAINGGIGEEGEFEDMASYPSTGRNPQVFCFAFLVVSVILSLFFYFTDCVLFFAFFMYLFFYPF